MSTDTFFDKRTEQFDPDNNGRNSTKPKYSVSGCSHQTVSSIQICGLENSYNEHKDREIIVPPEGITRSISHTGSTSPITPQPATRPTASPHSSCDDLEYETQDETVLGSVNSISPVSSRSLPIVNLSRNHFRAIETPRSTSGYNSPSSRGTYHEILQKWMEDRKRWENCRLEYEKKLKIAMTNQSRQKQHWLKESVKGVKRKEKLKLAKKTIRELKVKLKLVSERAVFLEKQYNLINRSKSNYTRCNSESCESMKKNLKSTFGSWCSHKKEVRGRGRSDASRTFRELEKHSGSMCLLDAERGTGAKIANEKPLLMSLHQRRKEKEVQRVCRHRKNYEHSKIKLQDAKLEIVGLRRSNSILSKRLEDLEKNIEKKIISSLKENVLGTRVKSLGTGKHGATLSPSLNPNPREAPSMTISDPVSECFLSKSSPMLTKSHFSKSDITMLKSIKDLLQIQNQQPSTLPCTSEVNNRSKRQKLSMSLSIKKKQKYLKKKKQRIKPNSYCLSMSRITQPVLANRRKLKKYVRDSCQYRETTI